MSLPKEFVSLVAAAGYGTPHSLPKKTEAKLKRLISLARQQPTPAESEAPSELSLSHVEEVLRQDILIASGVAGDQRRKRFTFVPWTNEYRVYHGGQVRDGGQALEELIEVYASL